MVNAVNPTHVWSPFGAFSMAVIQGDGQIVHLKGQVSLDRYGQVVGQNDMRRRYARFWRIFVTFWRRWAGKWQM